MELSDRYVLLTEQLAGRTKAVDQRYGGLVAVERRLIRSPEQSTRLMDRLGRLLELPPHPALPVLRDEFRIGDEHWLISNWVEGIVSAATVEPSTRDAGDAGKAGHPAIVLGRLTAVAEALGHLHQQQPALVHGALTPNSIIVTPAGRVVITGLYGEPDGESDAGLAPEVLAGQQPSVASDVYGLAAVAWHWLTGQPRGSSMPALVPSSRETAVLEHLLRSGLAHDPATRPESAAALVLRLRDRFQATLPVGTVTFLMTDVCRSTEQWQADPAGMAAAIDRHDRICAEAVEAFDGVFPRDQGEGDSVLVAFSRPSDAVGCADAIQRRLATEAWPSAVRLQVRMALHTGEAAVRNGNYRCIAVNTCARLRALAQGGQVLLSQVTAEIVRSALPPGARLLDLGGYRPKDLREPLRLFQLVVQGVEADLAPIRGSAGAPTAAAGGGAAPLLGRGTEMAALFAAMDSALDDRPRTVMLLGDPGMGKTRMCHELVGHLGQGDVRVIWGRCSEPTGTPAYWPWLQIVRAFLEDEDPDRLAGYLGHGMPEMCRAFPEVRQAFGDDVLPSTGELTPQEVRFRLFEAFMAFLRRAAADRPVLLVLDDMHWADQPSWLLLEFLSQHLSRARILIVATFSETAPGARTSPGERLGDTGRQPGTSSLVLRSLKREEVARFIETAAGAPPSAEMIEAIHGASEGNPFYLNEIVQLLKGEGRLSNARPAGQIALPRGVRSVILRRLSGRSQECTRLLSVAAAIGREFPIALAAVVAGLCSQDALAAVDEAVSAGLVTALEDAPGGRFAFSHLLIRQTVYDSLSQNRRIEVHLALASTLEQSVVLDAEHRRQLARHLLAAAPWSDLTKAISCARTVAQDLAAQGAYEDCAELYRAATNALRSSADDHGDVQCDLLLSEADAWWRAGQPTRCKEAAQQAAVVARAKGDTERLCLAALVADKPWIDWGVTDRATVDLLVDALALVPHDRLALRARLSARLAMELAPIEAPGRMSTRAAQMVSLARRSGDREVLAYTLLIQRHLLVRPEDVGERLACISESLALATESGNRELALRGRILRLADLLQSGETAAAIAELDRITRDTTALGDGFLVNGRVLLCGLDALLRGRFSEAEVYIEQTLQRGLQIDWRTMVEAGLVQLVSLRREQGRLAELENRIAGLLPAFDQVEPGWHAVLALLFLDTGRPELAQAQLELLIPQEGPVLPMDSVWLTTLCAVAEVAATLEDERRCGQLYELLLPYREQISVLVFTSLSVCFGSVARYLGLLATSLRRWEDAERHFARATEVNASLNSPPLLARVRMEWARMHTLRTDGVSDLPATALLLRQAVTAARELGMSDLADRAELLQQTPGGREPRKSAVQHSSQAAQSRS